jgi:hypothetical protein
MKRSQQSIPAAETGRVAGDYVGRRSNMQNPEKGGRNSTTNEARRGAGQVAPRPQAARQGLIASSSATAPTQASMARVKSTGKGNAQGRMPLQSPPANITGTKTQTSGTSQPPAQRGGPARLRAGGRNQNYPNGPMYRDGTIPGRGRGGELAKPKRKGLGAAFYGEY